MICMPNRVPTAMDKANAADGMSRKIELNHVLDASEAAVSTSLGIKISSIMMREKYGGAKEMRVPRITKSMKKIALPRYGRM